MRRSGRIAVAAAALGVVLAGCSSAAPPAVAPPTPPQAAPLTATLTTGTTTWAVVPMGHLDQPSNTFWQLFVRRAGAQDWSLVTPPGVADNGGLVLAAGAGNKLVAGFRPSQDLSFSPLAATADEGRTYTQGLVPAGIAASPDAFALQQHGAMAALTGRTGATVLAGTAASWRRLTSLTAVARTGAGRACEPLALTAIAARQGSFDLGAACARPGVVAVLAPSGSGYRLAGPTLPPALANRHAEVLRLVAPGQRTLAALIRLTGSGAPTYLAAWSRAGGTGWELSAPLAQPGALVSTAASSGGFAVLVRTTGGLRAALTAESGRTWSLLPAPPSGTSAIAVAGARVDALVARNNTFADYRLGAGHWSIVQSRTVPIQYGSSG